MTTPYASALKVSDGAAPTALNSINGKRILGHWAMAASGRHPRPLTADHPPDLGHPPPARGGGRPPLPPLASLASQPNQALS